MATRKRSSSRLTWIIIVAVWIFLLPFYYLDRMDLALPSLLAAVAIGCAIATFWKHKSQMWFWSAVVLTVLVHIYLIARFSFDNLGGSKIVFGVFALVDYGLIVGFIKLVDVFFNSSEAQHEP
jgi:hypothetical protein